MIELNPDFQPFIPESQEIGKILELPGSQHPPRQLLRRKLERLLPVLEVDTDTATDPSEDEDILLGKLKIPPVPTIDPLTILLAQDYLMRNVHGKDEQSPGTLLAIAEHAASIRLHPHCKSPNQRGYYDK